MVAVAEVKGVRSHRLLTVAFIVLTACGGTANSSTALPEASAVTAERSCIELANVIREPRAGEPDSVHVKHVLVKHKDAKNPREGVARSREEACERAIVARDKVIGGADFDQVVTEFSDEAGAATRAGELGVVRRSVRGSRECTPPADGPGLARGRHHPSALSASESRADEQRRGRP
jgi:hypothetical protein